MKRKLNTTNGEFEFLFRFIQQEVQNLLHEIERRDNECRRLNHQAINSEQQLEKTSDKLQTVESKSITQAKKIKVSCRQMHARLIILS